MLRTTCLIATLLTLTNPASANDGAYLTRGGAIYPMKETRISMAREFLSFTCAGEVATVQVLFEFNNPDSAARKLLVGFQAPTAHGDVSDSIVEASHIRGMKIMVDGKLLAYSLKAAACEDCPLGDVSAFAFQGDNPGVHVYLFEITFMPGITRVQHSYEFTASSNVVFDRMFNYILTTGSKWASSTIGDLTVEIDMGKNQLYYVTDVFGKNADWSFIGTGLVTDHVFEHYDNVACRMVRILSGKLRVHATDLSPTNNIEFGVASTSSLFGYPLQEQSGLSHQVHAALAYSTLDMTPFRLPPLTREDLRMLRNLIYAQHGYAFKDAALSAFFSKYEWYVPDPNMPAEAIPFTDEEKVLITSIVALEKE